MRSFDWTASVRADRGTDVRDDRVLPLTRWVARVIAPILAVAFLILYGMPDRTTELFAWTIRPEMTSIVMGAGYGAGVFFFYKVSTVDRWYGVAPVFLGIAAFTWAMAIATALHWENFNHGHPSFALWAALYAITPILVPAVWALNRRTGSDTLATGEVRLPRNVRLLGGLLGIVLTVGAVGIFLVPEILVATWPWAVSPLTTRILAGWFVLFGVVNGAVVSDPRWDAARIPVQSQLIGFSLVLLGVARARDDFDPSNPLTWGVVGGMALYLCAILVLYVRMEARKTAGRA